MFRGQQKQGKGSPMDAKGNIIDRKGKHGTERQVAPGGRALLESPLKDPCVFNLHS